LCCRETFYRSFNQLHSLRRSSGNSEPELSVFNRSQIHTFHSQRATSNRFIKNFDFDYPQTNSQFTVTSVSGHLLAHDFPDEYRQWNSCDPITLFDAPILSTVPTDNKSIERNLLAEARGADTLMIWTDCDREGENIGSEIVKVCKKSRPQIVVKRARFSAIIPQYVSRTLD